MNGAWEDGYWEDGRRSALEAADAIDELLDRAMASRVEAVGRFEEMSGKMRRYEHAAMYPRLNKLPKSKVVMFDQLSKAREELARLRDRHEREAKLAASQIKVLQRNEATLQQELEQAHRAEEVSRGELLQSVDELAVARKEILGLKSDLKRVEQLRAMDAERALAKQRAFAEEERQKTLDEEEKHRTVLEERIEKLELEKALLLQRQGELELQLDQANGRTAETKLALLSYEFGLPRPDSGAITEHWVGDNVTD